MYRMNSGYGDTAAALPTLSASGPSPLMLAGAGAMDAVDAATGLLDQTTGKLIPTNVPTSYGSVSFGCPTGHTCVLAPPTVKPGPAWSCLSDLVPGGL